MLIRRVLVLGRNPKLLFFFFQAEDGIRDLVRSRGLGDVYKRQDLRSLLSDTRVLTSLSSEKVRKAFITAEKLGARAVSYTHLTLPTSDLV